MIDGPVFNQAADGAGTDEGGCFDGHAHALGNFDDGLDVVLVRARGAVGADLHARGYDFAGEGFSVGVGARAGAGQADIHGVDAERFHQVKDFDFFGDGGIVDRRVLQTVTEGFVVEHDATIDGDFGAGVCVPVVDEFVFHCCGFRG